jgi:hypothetical protein
MASAGIREDDQRSPGLWLRPIVRTNIKLHKRGGKSLLGKRRRLLHFGQREPVIPCHILEPPVEIRLVVRRS